MKKYFGILIVVVLIMGIYIMLNKDNKSDTNEVLENTKEEIKPTGMNSLAIMLQNDEGGYDLKDMESWPTDGYVFNPDLSRCENGGKLSWNEGKITLKTNGSDKCYVYFDKIKPSSFTIDDMDSDFYTLCSIQISYDKGMTWQDYQLSTKRDDITNLSEGTMLRVNNIGYHDYCSIKICEEAICSISGDNSYSYCGDYSVSSGDKSREYYGRKDYTVKGGGAYVYSLSYCTCLTGDNDI